MTETIKVSRSPMQSAWIKARKEQEGLASASHVIRDLSRREQEKEWTVLSAEFDRLSKAGAAHPEPVEEINRIVGRFKKEQREAPRRS